MTQPGGDRAFPAEELSGRLSAPSWSPDSKRIYVVARDETGARLVEVSRSTLSVRPLTLPPLPGGLQPASVAVSPDGAFVLAVADRPDREVRGRRARPRRPAVPRPVRPGRRRRLVPRQIAPGLGRVFSPVWVDPVTVAFIAETSNKDDLGKLWTVKSDGWDPTAVLNDSDIPIGDIGNHLTVDPTGRGPSSSPPRSSNGASLWMVNRRRSRSDYLTVPTANAFDVDPSFASR